MAKTKSKDKWEKKEELFCVKCGAPLEAVKLEKKSEVPSWLMCPNEKCPRFGLLSVVFKRFEGKEVK